MQRQSRQLWPEQCQKCQNLSMMVVRDLWIWIRCITTKVAEKTGKTRKEKEKEKAKILKVKAKAKVRKARKVDTKRQEKVQWI